MVKEEKTERFAVRLSPSELSMLHELGEAEGESDSVALRRAIRRTFRRHSPLAKVRVKLTR